MSTIKFMHELGHLRRVRHEGWALLGLCPHSVAEHSLRAAQIGYILAILENYESPEVVSTILIFHDMGETRIGDVHKVANEYINADEERAVKDQTKNLPFGEKIFDLWKQMELKSTTAGIIAKDADLLEQAVSSKEFIEQGFRDAQNWIDNVEKKLRTQSAKKLLEELKMGSEVSWWKGLKKLD